MTHPRPVVPHIHGTVSLPSTGMGSPKLAMSQANAVSNPTAPIRSSGRITPQAARAARNAAARSLRHNERRVLVVG